MLLIYEEILPQYQDYLNPMGRYPYANTYTVEECRSIDTAWLKKYGYFDSRKRAGAVTWRIYGTENSIAFVVDTEEKYIEFIYKQEYSNGEIKSLNYKARLDTTTPQFGGKRYWFICPLRGCGRKVNALYLSPNASYFGCRHCHRLTYKSCRESGTKYSKLKRSIKRIDPVKGAKLLYEMANAGDIYALRIIGEELEKSTGNR